MAAMTGITINSNVLEAYEQVKDRKQKYRYAIFEIESKKEVVCVKKVEQKEDEKWTDFCEEFKDNECRYAIYMVPIMAGENTFDDKPLLLAWNGPDAGVKARMLHAGTLQAFVQKLKAGELTEIADRDTLQDIEEICKSKFRSSYMGK